jgi:phosphoglycerate dehydrogenase-like enzyme
VISLAPRYTAESLQGVERLVAIVRFGVGYDMVDVAACTRADVLLCITSGAVNHSVAEATITWMLALSHRVFVKDRLTREGRWTERALHTGTELRDRTLGVVGIGGIGGRLVEMLRGFGMKPPLAFDPYTPAQRAAELGVTLVSLERLMKESDFVSINCPLNDQTRNLIGRDHLALMKPGAFLINTARGGIVNEEALIETLRDRRIAGAAMDVFASEPVKSGHPLAQLDNVILAPHCIAWTDELFRDIGQMACRITAAISRGEVPPGVVNRDVLECKSV